MNMIMDIDKINALLTEAEILRNEIVATLRIRYPLVEVTQKVIDENADLKDCLGEEFAGDREHALLEGYDDLAFEDCSLPVLIEILESIKHQAWILEGGT